MKSLIRPLAITLVLAPLAACSVFGGDAEEESVAAAPVAAEPMIRPIESVRGVEIGRTRDGVVLTAYGIAPGLGYASPQLRERRGGRIGTDGYLDFDFVATAPDREFQLPEGKPQARILRADRLLAIEVLQQARGIRIHDARGGQQIEF